MRGKLRYLGLALVATAGAAFPLWGPPLLRHASWFGIRRVEVSGARLLSAREVLAASGIRPGDNLWEPLDAWESALLRSPVIESAELSRALPRTLRIHVTEKRAVAYVENGALEPITAAGELLPVDPTRSAVDLPVIRGSWQRIAPPVRRALLDETDRLSRLAPGLLAGVSELRPGDRAAETIVLRHRLAEIVLPVGADADRLAELRAVLADLETRAGGSRGIARVDLRFRESVVVRLPSSA